MQILQHAPGRWLVEGSKGQAYHVKRWVEISDMLPASESSTWVNWSCDCLGSINGHECRHIKAVKAQLAAES